MKYPPRQFFTLENSDKKLASFFIGIGIIGVILTSTVFPSILILQASVTLLSAAAIYLIFRARRRVSPIGEDEGKCTNTILLQPHFSKLLDIAFWGLLIASLIILSQGLYARPLSFLILVSIMAAILAVQIFAGKNIAYCLMQIFVIGILLRASAWYQFPGPVGYDSIVELRILEQLVANGHTGDFMMGYQFYPVAQFFAASTSVITGLEARDSLIILSVVQTVGLVFLFLIGKQLFNERTGLLAAMIMAIFDWHVFWGFNVKTFTMGLTWIPFLIFILLIRQRNNSLLFPILSILIILLATLTHPFITTAIVLILITGWLLSQIIKRVIGNEKFNPPITLGLALTSFCVALVYWTYASGFTEYIGYIYRYAIGLEVESGRIGAVTFSPNIAQMIWMRLPIFLLLFFTTLGCLTIFNIRKLNQKALMQIWLALLGGIIILINFIIYSVSTLSLLITERWFVIMGLIVALPTAVGLMSIPGKKGWHNMVVIFLLMFLLSGIMTTSYTGSVKPVIPWEPSKRDAATLSELVAARTVSQMTGLTLDSTPEVDSRIYADHYYSHIFLRHLHIPPDNVVDLYSLTLEEFEKYHGILMLRTDFANLLLESASIVIKKNQYQSLTDDPQIILMYNNGMVKALRR